MLIMPDIFTPYIKGRETAIAANWADRDNYNKTHNDILRNVLFRNTLDDQIRNSRTDAESNALKLKLFQDTYDDQKQYPAAQLADLLSQTQGRNAVTAGQLGQNDLFRDTYADRARMVGGQADYQEAQTRGLDAQTADQQTRNEFLPESLRMAALLTGHKVREGDREDIRASQNFGRQLGVDAAELNAKRAGFELAQEQSSAARPYVAPMVQQAYEQGQATLGQTQAQTGLTQANTRTADIETAIRQQQKAWTDFQNRYAAPGVALRGEEDLFALENLLRQQPFGRHAQQQELQSRAIQAQDQAREQYHSQLTRMNTPVEIQAIYRANTPDEAIAATVNAQRLGLDEQLVARAVKDWEGYQSGLRDFFSQTLGPEVMSYLPGNSNPMLDPLQASLFALPQEDQNILADILDPSLRGQMSRGVQRWTPRPGQFVGRKWQRSMASSPEELLDFYRRTHQQDLDRVGLTPELLQRWFTAGGN